MRSRATRALKRRRTADTGGMVRAGQRVSLAVAEQPGQPPTYYIQDLERGRPMLILAALFVGAVIAFGRWQGIRSLLGLGLSFLVIIGFVVPAILRGHSPVAVAVTGAMAIMLSSLYLAHGIGPKTTAAVVGTALALGLTAALSIVFVAASSLTGLASEDALSANFAVGGLSLHRLRHRDRLAGHGGDLRAGGRGGGPSPVRIGRLIAAVPLTPCWPPPAEEANAFQP
jgi:uncharacterized membrane protein